MPRLGNKGNGHTILAGKLPAQDLVGRSGRRWRNKTDVREVGYNVGGGCN